MAQEFQKVVDRKALAPRRDPYWMKLSKGCFLGFRKMASDADGTWLARARDEIRNEQKHQPLGDFSEWPQAERFDQAKRAAEAWFEHLGKGGTTGSYTIQAVCDAYLTHLRSDGKDASAKDAEARFANYVLDNLEFANTEVAKLTPLHVEAWKARLRARPSLSGPNRGKPRSASTLNRDMTPFRAALNLALADRRVTSDFAWKEKLKPIPKADKRRDLYLDKKERARLIEHADADLALFLTGLSVLPFRPGALAKLKISDFDSKQNVLTVPWEKKQDMRKLKLSPNVIELFRQLTQSASLESPLFRRANESAWNKDAWKGGIKAAAEKAGLPQKTTAYTLRHSTISDLVTEGVPLLTIAQISGTSRKMIEDHYAHLLADATVNALSILALK